MKLDRQGEVVVLSQAVSQSPKLEGEPPTLGPMFCSACIPDACTVPGLRYVLLNCINIVGTSLVHLTL